MIIAVDIREWRPGQQTGIGRFLEGFLRTAAAMRPMDRFLLVGDPGCEVRVLSDNIGIIRVPEPWTTWWDQVALSRVLARAGADVFYSPYIKVPLFSRVPVVSTMHDLTFLLLPEYNRTLWDRLVNRLFRVFCWFVVRRAAAIIVDSHASAGDVHRLLAPDPSKVRVIPLATTAVFHPETDQTADTAVWKRYGLGRGYLLYIGGFGPHKNVPLLVRAYSALPEALRARHPLVLVGGPIPQELRQMTVRGSGIRWIGHVPDSDLPNLYRGAVLFAYPSRYEGFGLPVLEAMVSGVPVLCSTAPALIELAVGAALHVNPDSQTEWEHALATALEDPLQRERLAAQGLRRSALYGLERMTDEILKVLDEVISSK